MTRGTERTEALTCTCTSDTEVPCGLVNGRVSAWEQGQGRCENLCGRGYRWRRCEAGVRDGRDV